MVSRLRNDSPCLHLVLYVPAESRTWRKLSTPVSVDDIFSSEKMNETVLSELGVYLFLFLFHGIHETLVYMLPGGIQLLLHSYFALIVRCTNGLITITISLVKNDVRNSYTSLNITDGIFHGFILVFSSFRLQSSFLHKIPALICLKLLNRLLLMDRLIKRKTYINCLLA